MGVVTPPLGKEGDNHTVVRSHGGTAVALRGHHLWNLLLYVRNRDAGLTCGQIVEGETQADATDSRRPYGAAFVGRTMKLYEDLYSGRVRAVRVTDGLDGICQGGCTAEEARPCPRLSDACEHEWARWDDAEMAQFYGLTCGQVVSSKMLVGILRSSCQP